MTFNLDEDAEGEYRLQDEENDLINNYDNNNDYWKSLQHTFM